jgi:hypothetical protein
MADEGLVMVLDGKRSFCSDIAPSDEFGPHCKLYVYTIWIHRSVIPKTLHVDCHAGRKEPAALGVSHLDCKRGLCAMTCANVREQGGQILRHGRQAQFDPALRSDRFTSDQAHTIELVQSISLDPGAAKFIAA